jgi:hypothetical protein
MVDVPLLVEVAGNEALHARHRAAVEDLKVDGREVVVRIGRELALILGFRLHLHDLSRRIGIGFGAAKAVDGVVLLKEPAEHVVERAVLHHQHDEVLEIVEAWRRHKASAPRLRVGERAILARSADETFAVDEPYDHR